MRNRYGIGRFKRRATVMVQTVAFGSTVAVGVAALAVDTGLMFSAKQELQTAADAAALAAASQLGVTDGDPFEAARAEAQKYANANGVMGEGADVVNSDVIFGHAVKNGEKFDFFPGVEPYDAVQVTLKRDATVADGPVSLFFGQTLGMNSADMLGGLVVVAVTSIAYSFMGGKQDTDDIVKRRSAGLSKDDDPKVIQERARKNAKAGFFEKAAPLLSKPVMPKNAEEESTLRAKLACAGFRKDAAPTLFLASKTVVAVIGAIVATMYALGGEREMIEVVGFGVGGFGAGFMIAGPRATTGELSPTRPLR